MADADVIGDVAGLPAAYIGNVTNAPLLVTPCAANVMPVEGKLYWYLTPSEDRRSRVHDERAIETAPRRRKRRVTT